MQIESYISLATLLLYIVTVTAGFYYASHVIHQFQASETLDFKQPFKTFFSINLVPKQIPLEGTLNSQWYDKDLGQNLNYERSNGVSLPRPQTLTERKNNKPKEKAVSFTLIFKFTVDYTVNTEHKSFEQRKMQDLYVEMAEIIHTQLALHNHNLLETKPLNTITQRVNTDIIKALEETISFLSANNFRIVDRKNIHN